ncbi:sensor histidine kinase [Saccharothrix sp. Mg75]|uniref:sensor histidine kinase n=1 Tax=Saccharothrix sp. Mg75 TaxID=3445357 RepID=UPI003EEAC194
MRPVSWLSPLLCGVVLVAGGYAGVAGFGVTRWVPFALGLAALVAVGSARRLPAWAVLAAQAALVVLVTWADGSGMARVLFVLLPFGAYFAFGRRGSVVVGVGCAAVMVVAFQVTAPGWERSAEHVSDLLMFGIGVVLAVAMAELSAAAERVRVARDLHDGVGHHLTAVAVLLERAEAFRGVDPASADRAVSDARESAKRALEDVRLSVRALREPFRLAESLQRLARGLDVVVDCTGDESRYATTTLLALYRAAQEGVTNALRHAAGRDVVVTVHCGAEAAELVVADGGPGAGGDEGFGLRGLRERVAQVGGSVDVRGAAGTRLTVVVPRRAA